MKNKTTNTPADTAARAAALADLGLSPDALAGRQAELLTLLRQTVPEVMSDNQIDLVKLKDLLGQERIADPQEHYELSWAGKTAARREIQKTSSHTLRPDANNPAKAQHMLIEGENLEVLRVLQKSYYGKVKMIYIDPPYNTGNDSFVYPDNYSETLDEYQRRTGEKNEAGYLNKQSLWKKNSKESGQYHSAWLSMMHPRLYLARNLLRDDGVIFISIDDNEVANLKVLCDEIFGGENFVDTIIWEKRYSPQNAVQWFSEVHDYVIVYAKNKIKWQPNLLDRTEEMNARYRNLDGDSRGDWKPVDSTAQGGHGTASQFYTLTSPNGKQHNPASGRCWLYTHEVMQKMIADNRVWFGVDGNNMPAIKRFITEVKQGMACKTLWRYDEVGHNQEAKKEIKLLFNDATPFETPKPTRLINRMLRLATDKDSIILDFFSGSGTTAHATMDLDVEDGGNRQSISVQMPEVLDEDSEAYKAGYRTIADITRARIDKVIASELGQLREGGQVTPDLVFRDPYMLDFLGLPDGYSERDLESAILRDMERFLLELGAGFTFVARQKRISVGADDFYLDLLFFHRHLRRLVAVELKLEKFSPSHKGQMELYLRWLDQNDRAEGEASPIGLILCASADAEQVELMDLDSANIRVAQYLHALPELQVLQTQLHRVVQLARERQATLDQPDNKDET